MKVHRTTIQVTRLQATALLAQLLMRYVAGRDAGGTAHVPGRVAGAAATDGAALAAHCG